MKKLLITLLLISPFSFADWDDVYYCQMTRFVGITPGGFEKVNYDPENFQFKLDKAKNAVVFGGSGYLAGIVIELREEVSRPELERWYAGNYRSIAHLDHRQFIYVSAGPMGSKSISADCDKF